MASVTVFTAERMLEIEGGTVVSGSVDESGNLILIRRDETTINAGPVKGDDGYIGSDGPPGPPGADALGVGMVVFWPGSGSIPSNCLESGTTYFGGASVYTALAAIYPEWVVGADLIIPDFGGKALIGKRSKSSIGTATITIASPGVVTKASHGLYDGQRVSFTTTGALPTGLSSTTRYFVRDVTLNTFRLASTFGGAAINTSASQSGVHTLWDDDFTVIGESVGSKSHRHDFKIGLWDNAYSAAGARAAMQADVDTAALRAGAFRHSDELFSGSIVSGSPQTLTRGTPTSGSGSSQRFESTGDTQVGSTIQPSYVGRWLVIAADSAGEYSPTVQTALVAQGIDHEAALASGQMWYPVSNVAITSFAGSGSSATKDSAGKILFANISDLKLDSCYDTDEFEYMWDITVTSSNSATDINYRGRTATPADETGGVYGYGTIDRSVAGGLTGGAADSGNAFYGFLRSNGTGGGKTKLFISGSRLAEYTWAFSTMRDAAFLREFSGTIKNTTPYPGATFFTAGALITGRMQLFKRRAA